MKRTLTLVLAFVLALGMFGGPALADGSDDNDANRDNDRPHVNWEVDGTKVELEFVNPTNFAWSFDYRVDGEPEGTEDDWTGEEISEGPLEGQDFGLRYESVTLIGEGSETVTVDALDEVEVRLARGAEQMWYFDWITIEAVTCVVDLVRDDEDGETQLIDRSHSVQEAVDAAQAGDTVLVSGTCEENVDIRGGPKAVLTLTSKDSDDPATIAPDSGVGVFVTALDATVTHLIIDAPSHGITVGGSGVTIEHNTIDAGNRGVNVGNSTAATINHNLVNAEGSGVRIAPGGADNVLNHNEVQGDPEGLGVDVLGTANTVHHNDVDGRVRTQSVSEGNSIKHNTFDLCTNDGTENDWHRNTPDDCDVPRGRP